MHTFLQYTGKDTTITGLNHNLIKQRFFWTMHNTYLINRVHNFPFFKFHRSAPPQTSSVFLRLPLSAHTLAVNLSPYSPNQIIPIYTDILYSSPPHPPLVVGAQMPVHISVSVTFFPCALTSAVLLD